MEPQRWQRIGEIYHAALPLAPSARADFVSTACAGDSAIEHEVNSLLASDETSGDFLKTSVFEKGLELIANDSLQESETLPLNRGELTGVVLDERYLIEKELGHGGVGAVYLARDRKLLDKPVVVKVLLEKSLQNEWVVQKFQQEIEALARVDHPGVVGILDTGELPDGKPYIVMQFVDGVSLREAIKAKPEGMDLEHAASIIKQIGSALSAVHEKKIYHRDLKPENIMLQRLARGGEQVKILDFGIAKIKESVVAPSTMTGGGTAGTIVYMSPEQLRGTKVTAASDIYSLAVIAFEIVTGRRPFNPETIAHLAEMQRQGVRAKPADLRPRVSEQAEAIILNGLAFDPRVRPQAAAEFGDELSAALMKDDDPFGEDTGVEIPPTRVSVDPVSAGLGTTPSTAETIMTPFDPAPSHTFQPPVSYDEPEPRKMRWPLLVAGLFVIAVVAVGAFLLISNRQSLFGDGAKTGSANPVSPRALSYSLTVQKMRDGKPYQEPFESSGQEVFENGYKFRLNVSNLQSGYLYVFNEGAPEKDKTDFTIIYPTPRTNSGSAKIEANQKIQTSWNTFAGASGTENFWIIWSATAVSELESARDEAFKHQEGALTEAAMVKKVKDFLTKHSDPKLETTKDTKNQQTNVRGTNDPLVKLVELEHR